MFGLEQQLAGFSRLAERFQIERHCQLSGTVPCLPQPFSSASHEVLFVAPVQDATRKWSRVLRNAVLVRTTLTKALQLLHPRLSRYYPVLHP